MVGRGQNLGRPNVEPPIFRKFKIVTIRNNRKSVIQFLYFRHLFSHLFKLIEHAKIFDNFFNWEFL